MRLLILGLILTLISCKSESQNQDSLIGETTYYLIRHADKDRQTKGNGDPGLNQRGKERAQEWVKILMDEGITMIYSTDYVRTMSTAQPLANELKLSILSYDPSKLFDEKFKKATKGKNVLVVGHSNTTPAFVNAIIGENKYNELDDDNNGALFKVVIEENGETIVTLKQYEDGF